MKLTLYIIVVSMFASTSRALYLNLKDNILSILKKPSDAPKVGRLFIDHARDKYLAPSIKILNRASEDKEFLATKIDKFIPSSFEQQSKLPRKSILRMDPLINSLKIRPANYRRNDQMPVIVTSGSSSSSKEFKDWKEEWKELWMVKKFEAVNSSILPSGDLVNMVAARPWGIPCGDPNQHDMPWGSCVLPMECEAEYRIYRGDKICGRTRFVCCAIQQTTYDLYQGIDASLADTSLLSNSDEDQYQRIHSKETRAHVKKKERDRRVKNRLKRKRQMKRMMKAIMREIHKILNKSFRNATAARKKTGKQLSKFIQDMKAQYKRNRKAVKEVHDQEMINIDAALYKRLDDMKKWNRNYSGNKTLNNIAVNGTISKAAARMLVKSYPELDSYFQLTRRNAGHSKDYLDYDIEYGLLYY